MNYIAHIHIGSHTGTSLVGNFLGDFVKGSQLQHLPSDIELGIRLHRSIDVFTDSHPTIVALRKNFPRDIRRMAGVIIDIYFDYLLMQTWPQHTKTDFNKVFTQFYQQLEQFSLPNNSHFNKQAERLITHQWLKEYINIETCFRAFLSIQSRLNNKVIFAEKAEAFVIEHGEQHESSFQQFYPECLEHGLRFVKSNSFTINARN